MTSLGRNLILLVCTHALIAQSHPVVTQIFELKSNAERYDGKVVHVTGWLNSGHIGVFLYDDQENSIRVRPPEDVTLGTGLKVRRDALFKEFWRQAEHEIPYSSRQSAVHVEFEAVVRVLKVGGKPARDFSVFGQFPVELIPLRVFRIDRK
jgi:hypothetical protein